MSKQQWAVTQHDGYMPDDMPPVQILDEAGQVVACNTTFYPTAITAERAAIIVSAVNEVAELREQLATARSALRTIEAWKLPATGKFWDNDDGTPSDRPMSYGACYGSNGERDYMRAIARQELS